MIDDDKPDYKHDGPFYPADAARLQSAAKAEQQLSQFQAPLFHRANDPHSRIFVACLDGTGNDKSNPRFGPETNVGRINDQILTLDNPRIKTGYTPGPGTEDGWLARTRDGISGATYNERVEDAYKQFIDQAKEWRREDAQAVISAVDMGFSRGAVEAAGLARLIEERGIQDPTGAKYTYDSHHQITHVEYTKTPLVAPGHVAQAELLFEPVATGYALKHEDLRPPPSVISGLQIRAADEHRVEFKSIHIIDPGMTTDKRFLGVTVAGAHSDIGGGYERDGLSLRSENIGINYLNSFSDTPFLQRAVVPDDPSLNVVHRSERVFPYDVMPTVDRATPAGNIERLVPQETHYHTTQTEHGAVTTVTHNERPGVSDPFNAEARTETLSRSFDWQTVKTEFPMTGQEKASDASLQNITAHSSTHDMFEAINAAVANKDMDAIGDISHAYLQSDNGQAWLAQGRELNQQTQAQQAALNAQQAQQVIQQQPQGFSR
jgi:hypothetical protein